MKLQSLEKLKWKKDTVTSVTITSISQTPTALYLLNSSDINSWTALLISLTSWLVASIINWKLTDKLSNKVQDLTNTVRRLYNEQMTISYEKEYSFFLDSKWTPELQKIPHRHWDELLYRARIATKHVIETGEPFECDFEFGEFLGSSFYVAHRKYHHLAIPTNNKNWVLWVIHKFTMIEDKK